MYVIERKRYITSGYLCQRQMVVTMQAIHPSSAAAGHVKILLDEDDLPRAWYNILPDLPAPFPPYLHPGTKEPVPPQAFEPLFPKELIRQEMSPNRSEPIPEELREAYLRFGRPTPLYRASRLEAFLKTPARIYYKREDLSPVGSHKPTPRSRRRTSPRRKGSRPSRRRRGPANGDPRSPSRRTISASGPRCSWSVSRTTRSPTGST